MSEDQHHQIARFQRVVDLLRRRNAIDAELASIIGRPAEKGHVGEWLASVLFDIELEHSATNAGRDGRFRSGPRAGRTVNIKWYARREGLLDVNPATLPDYHLMLTGPPASAESSRGASGPWVVTDAFLFETEGLLQELREQGVAIGTATSVQQDLWERARCRPAATPRLHGMRWSGRERRETSDADERLIWYARSRAIPNPQCGIVRPAFWLTK